MPRFAESCLLSDASLWWRHEHWAFSAGVGSFRIRGMGDPRHALGRAAEEAAAKLLERSGLRIVARNVKLRHGEIDLVCRDREVWVFVEGNCRQERRDAGPAAAVQWRRASPPARRPQVDAKLLPRPLRRCRSGLLPVTPRGPGCSRSRHIPAAFEAAGTA